jgi:hypothetical protein
VSVPSYQRHQFPGEIIAHAVWLYYRFALSFRDIEELLASRRRRAQSAGCDESCASTAIAGCESFRATTPATVTLNPPEVARCQLAIALGDCLKPLGLLSEISSARRQNRCNLDVYGNVTWLPEQLVLESHLEGCFDSA